jgi:hypothetical protein
MKLTWTVTCYSPAIAGNWYEPPEPEEICIEVEVAGFTFDHSELPPALAAHIELLALEDEWAKRQRGYDDY